MYAIRSYYALTGIPHDLIIQDTKNLLISMYGETGDNLFFKPYIVGHVGYIPHYNLPENEVLNLISRYSIEECGAVLKRLRSIARSEDMLQVEEKQEPVPATPPVKGLPNFNDPVEMARAFADLEYNLRKTTRERDEARDELVQLKAQPSNLNGTKYWYRVDEISWLGKYFNISRVAYLDIESYLDALSTKMGLNILSNHDSSRGSVPTYHKTVIAQLREDLDVSYSVLWQHRTGKSSEKTK